jgi:hypothetical protein
MIELLAPKLCETMRVVRARLLELTDLSVFDCFTCVYLKRFARFSKCVFQGGGPMS